LGDKVDLRISNWVLDFDNQSYNAEIATNWAVKKDGGQFDQFTGATITPRAVVNAVKLSIEYYLENQAAIFNAVNECAVNAISENAVTEDAVAKNENKSNE
jgi:electron transport complex protein RnfG